ncbi:MAG TPA: NOP5/NOP56 family protein [Candidatus Nanoarchaeia archaeon]|nr:NOP5/NOP56 family protein [Candidatus Nanoarchaeia archaeon]
MHIFSNVMGIFVFDGQFRIVEEIPFNTAGDYKNKERTIKEVKLRHENAKDPDEAALKTILTYFMNKKYYERFYSQNLKVTKLDVKNSVKDDTLIMQAINSIDELDRSINSLSKKLREWYGLYNPEFSKSEQDHEKFAAEIITTGKKELLDRIKISHDDSMGADLSQSNIDAINNLAEKINSLFQMRKDMFDYISSLMDSLCPNIKTVCGPLVAARLLEHAGSLKRLSELPSSTIQILGAETALFRHMKTGARPPRHGVIVHHPLIAKASEKMHGKVARSLADKISIAAKIDYFKGEFIGDKLLKELEAKFEK